MFTLSCCRPAASGSSLSIHVMTATLCNRSLPCAINKNKIHNIFAVQECAPGNTGLMSVLVICLNRKHTPNEPQCVVALHHTHYDDYMAQVTQFWVQHLGRMLGLFCPLRLQGCWQGLLSSTVRSLTAIHSLRWAHQHPSHAYRCWTVHACLQTSHWTKEYQYIMIINMPEWQSAYKAGCTCVLRYSDQVIIMNKAFQSED